VAVALLGTTLGLIQIKQDMVDVFGRSNSGVPVPDDGFKA
jgi:hypothetical protein